MTTTETNIADKAATVAVQGAHVAPEKSPAKKAATQKKDAPKAKKTGNGAKTKAPAPKKAVKAGAKASKKAAAPRVESKGAKILALIQRPKGATLGEIMKATDWQAHSVRGFISTAGKKRGVTIESEKNEAGDRTYRIGQVEPTASL